ncbi:Isochorismatase [hydrothermal vent metagenome]|uniref:Isochorismatase n=1 Tax=hydrothermal vent metagenome TaxID=652676 RepID=A0A3B0Z273_9ZZZZ
MKNTALIIIDIQNDYFPGGALTLDRADAAADKASKLLNMFREQKLPIVHIQHENTKLEMGFMLPGTFGQKIKEGLEPNNLETCFTKYYPSAFWQTELETHLKGLNIQHLVIAGMMTHMCVSSTTRAAMERGFLTTIIQDSCATRALEFDGDVISGETVHKTALAELTLISKITSLNDFSKENFGV